MSGSGQAEFFVQLPDGREFGPADAGLLDVWAKEGRIPPRAMIITRDGSPPVAAFEHPATRVALSAPPTVQGSLQVPADTGGETGDATGGVIPYKNPCALIGYYCAIASLIPFLGSIIGVVAIILGIFGLLAVKRQPKVRGTAHAWVAIVLGTLTMVGYPVLMLLISMR
jgi:hypothetical protein